MALFCHWCAAQNADGALACARCHNPLGEGSEASAARCPTHPEVPAATPCGRCGTFYCGQCLTARDRLWLCPKCLVLHGALPWDERQTLGLWRAWWRTSLQLISSPEAALGRADAEAEAPLSSSLLFVALSSLAGYATTLVAYGVFGVGVVAFGQDGEGASGLGSWLVAAPFLVVGGLAAVALMQVLSVLAAAGLDQLGLLVLGVRSRGYAVTLRANALSHAPYLLGLVPVCGLYVFPIWALVLRILAVRSLQRTTAGKAALAVLLPMLLLCGLCGGAYALLFAGVLLKSLGS
jgi:hypothetical protein